MSAPDAAVPTPQPATRPTKRKGRTAGWVILSLFLLLVALLVCGALLARDALAARSSLTEAIEKVPAVEEALRSGDGGAAEAALAEVQPLTADARASTDGPLWWLAGRAPFFGADVRAFSTAAWALDEITQEVLPPLAAAAATVSEGGVQVHDGTVDLAPLTAAAPQIESAAGTMTAVVDRVDALDVADLHDELAGPVVDLQDKVDTLDGLVTTAHRTTTLLPAMLGAEGPRTYVVMALNSAELRAPGGIPGAFAAIGTDDGTITLTGQASTSAVGPFPGGIRPLNPAEENLFGPNLATYVQDTVLTPDFPTAARLSADMWTASQGQEVDGVLTLDPVALSYLLEATGPVDVAGTTIDAGNAVSTLLSDAYEELDPGEETDAFFAAVASSVLSVALSGSTDPASLLSALQRASSEHRMLVWSAHEDEQELLTDTVVSGDIDSSERAADTVGVFFNDATAGKMDYYLDSSVQHVSSECTASGRSDTFRVDLTSDAPADAATDLPWYVTGGGISGTPPGNIRTDLFLYPPRGGRIVNTTADGTLTGSKVVENHGRAVAMLQRELSPGQSTSVTFTVTSGGTGGTSTSSSTGQIDVWSTPTIRQGGLATIEVPVCG
ncbi:DUF4012 domain-containing protein [Oerskovia merdavium]|uniref:DUF4012 domain-containing protein n=1 Tax=Oerskovia merdavium TaxID=2762227 RepID=A0ABR8TXU6_9CELL|nr:DUF4012 domain-containing protein [Oerskovia merdavium]MBD7980419.1 DUF4012 domain-containing protein [Oerskovia merdavium]